MKPIINKYQLDGTGVNPNNLVSGEVQTLTETGNGIILPFYGTFYTGSMVISKTTVADDVETVVVLTKDEDYSLVQANTEAQNETGLDCRAVVLITEPDLDATYTLSYQVVGGYYSYTSTMLQEAVDNALSGGVTVSYGNIVGLPTSFNPTEHLHLLGDLYGMEYLIEAINNITTAVAAGDEAQLATIYAKIATKLNTDDLTAELIWSLYQAAITDGGVVDANTLGGLSASDFFRSNQDVSFTRSFTMTQPGRGLNFVSGGYSTRVEVTPNNIFGGFDQSGLDGANNIHVAVSKGLSIGAGSTALWSFDTENSIFHSGTGIKHWNADKSHYTTTSTEGSDFKIDVNGVGNYLFDSSGNVTYSGPTFTVNNQLSVKSSMVVQDSLTVQGWSINLGSGDQVTRGNSGSSRALVKDTGNKLTINYGGDFTGGTKIGSSLLVDGTTTSDEFIGPLTGNSDTTTQLKTPRNINGTAFNGTGDITTSYWGTSRIISIGNTSKSVNGSSNVSWTQAEIGYTASDVLTKLKTVDGSGSGLDADLWDGQQFSSYLNQAVRTTDSVTFSGIVNNGKINIKSTGLTNPVKPTTLTEIRENAIHLDTINIGTNSRYIPLIGGTAMYAGGYMTHYSFGLHKSTSGWGLGNTGFYMVLGTNDNMPTEEFRFTTGGYISHTTGTIRFPGSIVASGGIVGNIDTATKWRTARRLTVGNTGKVVDGTANVSWSQAEIGYTAADVLAKLKTVDGSGSGLDSDLLDGQDGSYYRNASNINAGTISDARLPSSITSSITGNAATATKLATARTVSLSGAVTGSVSFDGSSNVTISTTATSDPTLTLSGDVSGSATFTNLGNATLNVAVANDSHTHDSRYYTESESDARFVNVTGDTMTGNLVVAGDVYVNNNKKVWHPGNDGSGSGLDADLWDGQQFSSYLNQTVRTGDFVKFDSIAINQTDGTGKGLSLYGSYLGAGFPEYGITFARTASGGTHGWVTGDWATYLTMTGGSSDRGWIFKHGSQNIGSLNTAGNLTLNGGIGAGGAIAINQTDGTGKGLSLYGSYLGAGFPEYGITFARTASGGTHGWVTGDWATYLTMTGGSSDRGWIFKHGSQNIGSLNTAGNLTLNGGIGAGGAISAYGSGNDYNVAAFMANGGGAQNSGIYPTIGFHQPGLWAGSIQQRNGNDFYFMKQGGVNKANIYASAFAGRLIGNSDTASAWSTARTFTVGNTAKSVNGSANVSWSQAEIGYTASDVLAKLKTVDGSGSGLDADKLDGVDGNRYLKSDSDSGAALLPTGTTAERPSSNPNGEFAYIRYNTDIEQWEGSYNGVNWSGLGGGASGGGSNTVFYENDIEITQSYTITTGKNAGTFGPIEIQNGVTVTVPSGSSWTVV